MQRSQGPGNAVASSSTSCASEWSHPIPEVFLRERERERSFIDIQEVTEGR
jgi:hypothetical protein